MSSPPPFPPDPEVSSEDDALMIIPALLTLLCFCLSLFSIP